ncbi:MAG: hypothetical protein RLZZ435_3305, partial [Cyanobacteriota bacterium]
MDLLALHLIHQLNVTSPKLPLGMTSPAPQVSLVPPSTAAESLFGTLPFTKAPLLGESPPSPAPSFWQIVRQQVSGPSRFVIRAVSRLWQGVMDRYQDPNLGVVGDLEDLLDDETVQHYVISPDAAQLHLASTDFLEHIPQQNPDTYQPDAGVRFNDDGSVTFRVLVGNTHDRLTLVGDFNNWGNVWNTASYQLFPTPNDPLIHEVTLPPGDYHLNQYRLR